LAADSVSEQVTVRAIPLSEEGERQVEQTTEDGAQLRINVRIPADPVPEEEPRDGLPPLGDALSNGWDLLSTAVNAVAVAAAFVLPFLWIPLLFVLALWRRRRGS